MLLLTLILTSATLEGLTSHQVVSGISPVISDASPLEYLPQYLDLSENDTSMEDTNAEYRTGFRSGHGDRFECKPCICSHSYHQFILANCSSRRLRDVPDSLPPELWLLNMTDNGMQLFNPESVQRYKNLNTLIISYNCKITHISNETFSNLTSGLVILNLTKNSIITIDDGSFHFFANLQQLDLGENRLTNITAGMFLGLRSLRYLNLTKNSIVFIENSTFDEMQHLKLLDLSLNKHLSYSVRKFPPRLFEKLFRLQSLYIQGNTIGDHSYPNSALQKLTNLQSLSSDALLNCTFGPQLQSLKHLKELHLGTNCRLKNLTRDFFQYIPYLNTFVISGCKLFYIDPEAYSNVPNLHTLELSHTSHTYDLYEAFEHLIGLQNSSLKVLRLKFMYRTHFPCRELHAQHAKYLQHIALEELDLSQNRIALIGLDFIRLLPRTLKKFVLNYNKITPYSFNIDQLAFLNNLLELDVENQKDDRTDFNSNDFSLATDSDHSIAPNSSTPLCNSLLYKTKLHKNQDLESAIVPLKNSWPVKLPPNLSKIKASEFLDYGFFILGHVFQDNCSLKEVDLSDSYFSDWGDLYLSPPIKKIDLSSNYCRRINQKFFPKNSPLVKLNMQNNFLGDDFANDKYGNIFRNLNKLLYLDISMNLIYKLPNRFLAGLTNLETLIVSDNKLQLLNLTFSHLTRLQLLDFSRNSITGITESTRDDLDAMAAITDFELDLTFNPLPCTCSGIELMKWLATTKVKLINQVNLQCRLENEVATSVGDLKERLNFLQRSCISKSLILVVSILSTMFMAVVLGLLLMYRYRWKLRYLRNVAIAKFIGFEPKKPHQGLFKYDAFLVYDSDDLQFVLNECVQELEVRRGLKLCIGDRDFMPGTYVASDIVSAVQNSYQTVLLVTPEFYDDVYVEYAVNMAINEEIHTSRQVLHLCLYQPVALAEMPRDLVAILKRNEFIEYPPEEEITPRLIESFWDQLTAAARQTD
ncbi:toll-like receptor 3 [Biomphalaria pfeifferi]|uniref:Toll-like receptor 3 n=1 Tax=Biomphalaria pfeifferi TaxID=112525 RepID=A0AAD8BIL6_BIOPF|nr:toll-like receptor 3 [Biomphalaria pfeifferi]